MFPAFDPLPEGRFVIALDPGHGGIDPGAEADGLREADLMLTFARELSEALIRTGVAEVVLTRNADVFVPLPERISVARAAQADVFLSLHADALANGTASGATVYTLSEEATDAASASLAEQHDRTDLLMGVDLTASDDGVAGVLMQLARLDTAPRSAALADAIVVAFSQADIPLHPRPRGEAGFSVLRAADIPSVLVEVGYMSTPADLERLRDPAWRQSAQDAIVAAIDKLGRGGCRAQQFETAVTGRNGDQPCSNSADNGVNIPVVRLGSRIFRVSWGYMSRP